MWTSRAGGATTSRGICAAPTATAARSARDAGEPVRAAGAGGRRDRGGAEGHRAGARPAEAVHDHPVAAARARRRGARDGAQAGPARAARPGLPAAGPGAGADHLPGGRPRRPSCPPWPGGPTPPSAPTWGSPAPPPTRSTRRWTGWPAGRTRSRSEAGRPAPGAGGEPVADGAVRPVALVDGGHGTARWPPAATPGTARKAGCRSSTGCSPTPRAARSRSGCSPATPPTRPRSPRSSRSSGTSSGWPRWSWSATAA